MVSSSIRYVDPAVMQAIWCRHKVGDFVLTDFYSGEIRNAELPEGSAGTIAAPDVNGEVISKRASPLFGRCSNRARTTGRVLFASVGIHSLVSLRLNGSLFETFLSRRFRTTYVREFRFSSGC